MRVNKSDGRRLPVLFSEGGAQNLSMKEKPPIDNEVSDETGEFDSRFRLWREFCAVQGIPVESLPSTLSSEVKQQWERFKEEAASGGE